MDQMSPVPSLACRVDQPREATMCKFLREHFLFKNMSSQQIDRLASCIVTKTVNRGGTIFAKGDPGSSMFAICKGTVKIGIASVDGHDAIFNLLRKGDIFGEIATRGAQTLLPPRIANFL